MAGGNLFRETLAGFVDDECPRHAAALAFYAVFCLPALVLLATLIASVLVDAADVRGSLAGRLGSLIGPGGASEVATILEQADADGSRSGIAAVLGTLALLLGASATFAQLQAALNTAWGVRPRERGVRHFVLKRLLSFGLLVIIGILLLASLVTSAFVGRITGSAVGWLPEMPASHALAALDFSVSLLLALVLFAAILKWIPDAEIAWRDVGLGAAVTALLFVVGQFLLGFYLGRSRHVGAYGAAGAIVLVMLWVYYSAMILLLGAEFTRSWARHVGRTIAPSRGAVWSGAAPDEEREPGG